LEGAITLTDFLDEKRSEITNQMQNLRPVVDEYTRLEAAVAALDSIADLNGSSGASPRSTPRRRGPGRPRGSKTVSKRASTATASVSASTAKPAAGRVRGRRKGTGKRSAQALAAIQAQPGITIPELATRLGIRQSYLYRVIPALGKEGKIVKQGRQWYPKEGAAT
jgi:hypothetical protein